MLKRKKERIPKTQNKRFWEKENVRIDRIQRRLKEGKEKFAGFEPNTKKRKKKARTRPPAICR